MLQVQKLVYQKQDSTGKSAFSKKIIHSTAFNKKFIDLRQGSASKTR
jgi:hypothetical protein